MSHTLDYYAAMKKHELLPRTRMWTKCRQIMRSGKGAAKGHTPCASINQRRENTRKSNLQCWEVDEPLPWQEAQVGVENALILVTVEVRQARMCAKFNMATCEVQEHFEPRVW